MKNPKSLLESPWLVWGCFASVFIFACYCLITIQPWSAAWRGGEVPGWIWVNLDPVTSAIDWPTGIRNFGKSLFMNLYKVLYQTFGIEPESVIPVVITLEVAGVALMYMVFARALLVKPRHSLIALIAIFAIASTARDINLGGFKQPLFLGLYYNAADVARMSGMLLLVTKRYRLAAVAFAFALAIHPVLGAVTCMVSLGVLFLQRKDLRWARLLQAAMIGAALIIPWLLLSYQNTTLSGGTIPQERWYTLTRMMNMHWYPVESGAFTTGHHFRFLPFLTFMGLLVTYWQRDDVLRPAIAPYVKLFTGGAMILTVIGVAISAAPPAPIFIKMSFHRASDLAIFWGLPIVVAGLWRDVVSGPKLYKAAALLVLVTPFTGGAYYAYPAVPALFLILPPLINSWRASEKKSLLSDRLALTILCLAIGALLFLPDLPHKWLSRSYTGFDWFTGLWKQSVVYAILLIAFLLALLFIPRKFSELGVFGLLIALALHWSYGHRFNLRNFTDMQDFMEVQLWARDSTAKDALFLNDPAQVYGWRDYSRRASAGIPREWLHNAWLYDSNEELYHQGLKRFQEYNLDLEKYIAMGNANFKAYKALQKDLTLRHNELPDQWRQHMAATYDIDYFVYARKRMRFTSELPIAFENDSFVVYAVERLREQ